MKENKLKITIDKPVHEVFVFTVTPPNSKLWIPSIIEEKTNETQVRRGTVYTLKTNSGDSFNVIVKDVIKDEYIEWISEDNNYHCGYSYIPVEKYITLLQYTEWVDGGEISEPFSWEILKNLKKTLENL